MSRVRVGHPTRSIVIERVRTIHLSRARHYPLKRADRRSAQVRCLPVPRAQKSGPGLIRVRFFAHVEPANNALEPTAGLPALAGSGAHGTSESCGPVRSRLTASGDPPALGTFVGRGAQVI